MASARQKSAGGNKKSPAAGASSTVLSTGGARRKVGFPTELKRAAEELRIAAIAFESSQEGMVVTNSKGVIVQVNQAFTRLTGYSASEAVGQKPALLRSGRQDKAFYERLWATLSETKY